MRSAKPNIDRAVKVVGLRRTQPNLHRFGLRLDRQAFADRYHIPLVTLIAWERHESVPDAVAVAFLDAIAADPDGVAKALLKAKADREAAE